MGLSSRQEVNLRRLLAKCELMCRNNQKNDERFPKYIDSLEDMYQEVKKLLEPGNESLHLYRRRISSIKAELGISTIEQIETDMGTIRNDLLGLRKRAVPGNEADADELLKYNEDMQSKITDHMLSLTQSLKEQSEIANKVIKRDTEVIGKSTDLTEKNFGNLTIKSQELTEHSKRAWKCWLWVLLVIVLVCFINMVLFMKVMKK